MSRFARIFYTLFLLAPPGLPFAIAHLRGHHQCWAILVVNLIAFALAWTLWWVEDDGIAVIALVLWLAALVWACTAVKREFTASDLGQLAVARALNV
jgi:hypothetical protein